jgi:hypothetical protein
MQMVALSSPKSCIIEQSKAVSVSNVRLIMFSPASRGLDTHHRRAALQPQLIRCAQLPRAVELPRPLSHTALAPEVRPHAAAREIALDLHAYAQALVVAGMRETHAA